MRMVLLCGQTYQKSPSSPFKQAIQCYHLISVRLTAATILCIIGGMAGMMLIASAAPAFTGCGGDQVAVVNASFEAKVVEIVNLRRAEQGLPPMKFEPLLANAARYHAADMSQDNYFEHNSYDRINNALVQICEWSKRILVYYPSPRAENIASGHTSPESVMVGWMNSPGHRANILGNNREVGVGFYENRWVQDFGTRTDVYPLLINAEAPQTDLFDVTLFIYGTWEQMRLRNDADAWGEWLPFHNQSSWTLNPVVGLRTVEVELRSGAKTAHSSDSIDLTTGEAPAPTVTPVPTLTPNPILTPSPTPIITYSMKIFLPIVQR